MILYKRKTLQLSSVIRQKGKCKNGCFKKTKHAEFPQNEHFLLPDTHTYVCVSGGINFSENLVCFVFLKHPFLDSPFCVITNELIVAIENFSPNGLLF